MTLAGLARVLAVLLLLVVPSLSLPGRGKGEGWTRTNAGSFSGQIPSPASPALVHFSAATSLPLLGEGALISRPLGTYTFPGLRFPADPNELPYRPPRDGPLAGMVIGLDPGHDEEWNMGAPAYIQLPDRVLGIPEHDITLTVAYILKGRLEAEGARVCVTRSRAGDMWIEPVDFSGDEQVRPTMQALEDIYEVIQPRIDWLNRCRADVVVSIHFNGWLDPEMRGTEVYYPDKPTDDPANVVFASLVIGAVVDAMSAAGYPAVSRGSLSENYQSHDEPMRLELLQHYGFEASCEDCDRLSILGNNPMSKHPLEAPYRVLIEVDYLSNPDFARRLIEPGFLQYVAAGLAEGVLSFAGYLRAREAPQCLSASNPATDAFGLPRPDPPGRE